jgi:hypothetical protein
VTESAYRDADPGRRGRARRLTLLLALAAAGVYVTFILLHVLQAKG